MERPKLEPNQCKAPSWSKPHQRGSSRQSGRQRKAMERTILFVCLFVTIESDLIKQYHFISEALPWEAAQAYCREKHTDLAFIYNRMDEVELLQLTNVSGQYTVGLIGLHAETNSTAWEWSGGGRVTYTNWGSGQPDNYMYRENKVQIRKDGKWNDVSGVQSQAFYCISLSVLEEELTPWEEALEQCRRRSSHLVSLLSENHVRVAQSAMHRGGTQRMWIGLRFLAGRWLWVSGERLMFQAWSPGAGEDRQCPSWNRCAALTKEGLWETTDCQERLPFMCT